VVRDARATVRSLREDVSRVGTLAYWTAIAIALGSFVQAAREGGGALVALGVGVLAVLAWRFPRWRTHIIALSAAVTLTWVPVAPLEGAAAALLYLAIAHDRRDIPWPALLAGAVGSVLAVLVHPELASLAPFAAALIGIALGLLVRALVHSNELTREARTLRAQTRMSEEQARWLEQRTALARELHDVVGHHVTAMVVQAEAGQVGDPQTSLRTIADLGRTALGELDGLVVHLRNPQFPIAMSAPPRLGDIEEVLSAPLRLQGVDVEVHLGADLGLDDGAQLTAYRIVQESLTNVVRHASASHAWVEVAPAGDRVRLRISDDGVGAADRPHRGAGLTGIDERVRAISGTWSITERPGGGTVVDVLLPQRAALGDR
jgi:signal transduction histidine kinase